jgi:prepilin-type N-terminal cleavage/methylation domain-containing protein
LKAIPNGFRGAFTLVELMVVVIIISLLLALLIPAVQSARESGRRAKCSNNLRQIGVSLQAYAEAKETLPPGCVVSTGAFPEYDPWTEASATSGSGLKGYSWMLLILPFMEQDNLYNNWDFTQNVLGNAAVAQKNNAVRCDWEIPTACWMIHGPVAARIMEAAWAPVTGGATIPPAAIIISSLKVSSPPNVGTTSSM